MSRWEWEPAREWPWREIPPARPRPEDADASAPAFQEPSEPAAGDVHPDASSEAEPAADRLSAAPDHEAVRPPALVPFQSFDVTAHAHPLVHPPSAALPVVRYSAWKDEVFAWVRTLLSAAVYATLIVTFGFQVARVEGESMAPTLQDQDRLIVNKLVYRLGAPRRGDIVMLYYPKDPDKSFVKRVIAEEGDIVKIEDGRVYVNDVPMDDSFVPPEFRSYEDQPPMRIEDGYYYVMGDHRNNSSDSRHWGEVPKKYIIGKVQLRWWPIPNATVF